MASSRERQAGCGPRHGGHPQGLETILGSITVASAAAGLPEPHLSQTPGVRCWELTPGQVFGSSVWIPDHNLTLPALFKIEVVLPPTDLLHDYKFASNFSEGCK